nr:MAG TPA: hypothetical protein [Caudoviricetes sp.]
MLHPFSSPLFRDFIIALRLAFVKLLCYNIFGIKNMIQIIGKGRIF